MTEPYYSDGAVTIFHADVRELEAADLAAQCVVTSPPYNVGLDGYGHDDARPWVDYRDLADTSAGVMARALEAGGGGRCWVNVVPVVPDEPIEGGAHSGRTRKDRVGLLPLWWLALEMVGMGVVDVVCWNKTPALPDTAWGSWQLPTAPNLRGGWEAVLAAHVGPWERDVPAGMEGWRDGVGAWEKLAMNLWTIWPIQRHKGDSGHPAPFPVELPERCIRLSTWPGEVVLDPFMGSGSTLIAARGLGRRAIGVDREERWCELAAKRLSQGILEFDVEPEMVDVPTRAVL